MQSVASEPCLARLHIGFKCYSCLYQSFELFQGAKYLSDRLQIAFHTFCFFLQHLRSKLYAFGSVKRCNKSFEGRRTKAALLIKMAETIEGWNLSCSHLLQYLLQFALAGLAICFVHCTVFF